MEKASTKGLKAGWTRHSIILRETTISRLQAYAYTERKLIREAADEIISAFLDEYEKTHKLLEPPKRG